MVMLDYDYNANADLFELDKAFYATDIEKEGWKIQFPISEVGEQIMVVFVDIYGNEARIVIPRKEFAADSKSRARAKAVPAAKKSARNTTKVATKKTSKTSVAIKKSTTTSKKKSVSKTKSISAKTPTKKRAVAKQK
jgi:hypothetical protein